MTTTPVYDDTLQSVPRATQVAVLKALRSKHRGHLPPLAVVELAGENMARRAEVELGEHAILDRRRYADV